MLFLTAGSGITPVMSMLRTLSRRDQITDIVHLHSAPTESDVMFAAELAELQRSHPGYRLRVRTTRDAGPPRLCPARRRGARLARPADLGLRAGGHARPPPSGVWAAAGIDERLHLERFAVSRAAAHGQGGTVEFARSGKTVTVDAATPLMDAGEGAGVQMPFGCRMGICQSCVVGLLDGHVRDLRTGVEHEPGSRVQTCISAASGDCVLDA